MKEKIKTTSFWLGVSGALVVTLDTLSGIFGVQLYSKEVETVVLTVCTILIMLGFVTKKNTGDRVEISKQDLLDEVDQEKENAED